MIQYLNNNRSSFVTYFIVALVSIPFIFFGATSLFDANQRVTEVAEIDGVAIDRFKFYRALQERQQFLLEEYADQITEEDVTEDKIGPSVLRDLVEKEAIIIALKRSGMAFDHEMIKRQIVQMDQFKVDDVFSQTIYRETLNSLGYTSKTFIQGLEESELLRYYNTIINSTSFVDDASLEDYVKILGENRSYDYIKLDLQQQIDLTEVDESELVAYYDANKENFTIDDQVKVSYVAVSYSTLRQAVTVSDEEVEIYYQQQLQQPISESKEVAHILIEDKAGSEEVLESVLLQLQQGSDFEQLVLDYSDDFGSKDIGGYLGFTSGDTFPEAFEDAVKQLTDVGQYSPIVRTDAGSHIIQLVGIETNELGTLDDERDNLKDILLDAKAEQRFNELVDQMNEISFPAVNLEPLTQIAAEVTMTITQSDFFTRAGVGDDFFVNYPQLIAKAFSNEVMQQNRNSEVIIVEDPISGEQYAVVMHLAEVKPRHIPELAEIQEDITVLVQKEKATQTLFDQAQDLFKIVKAGTTVEDLALQQDLDWQVRLNQVRSDPYEPNVTLFSVEEKEVPYNKIIQDYDGNFYIVHVSEVNEGSLEDYTAEQIEEIVLQNENIEATLELYAMRLHIFNNASIDSHLPIIDR